MSSTERRNLETELVLRAGHLPSCGEGAEFPWDCTCDYGGFMEKLERVLAVPEGLDVEARRGGIRCVTEGHWPFRSASCPTCQLLADLAARPIVEDGRDGA